MKPTRLALMCTSLLAVIPACAADGAGDAEDGVSDVATGKADSPSSADAALILELVNDVRLQDHDFDEAVGLSERVAKAIVAHRDGEDSEYATDDDNHFDNLEELDAIPHVGPTAMSAMLTYAKAHKVPTKLRLDLVAREWNDAAERWETVKLESLNADLANDGITFDAQLTLGARDGIKFLRVLKNVEKASEKLGREIDFDFTWDPSDYTNLCYSGEVKRIPDAVEGLRSSLFSDYMGIQGERWGTTKKFHYSGAGGETESEWIAAQEEQDNGDTMAAWTSFDTASKDFLMMTDGGQQGDGTELFAVTIKPCL
ncbi:MAG: hypothetical protein SFX73_25915 [Kofleriaceae bacterium]|nr:hypothetical protein [Kofleriaceae bacterium]